MPQARTFSGQSSRVRTTFDYLANSTELTGRTYDYDNNVTTDVSFQYYRSGLLKQVSDATGTRVFTYTAQLLPDVETLDSTWYAGRKLARQYDTQKRPIGL